MSMFYTVNVVTHKNVVSAGVFPLQLNLQQGSQTQSQLPPHFSPPPWDTSGLEQTKVVKRQYYYNISH